MEPALRALEPEQIQLLYQTELMKAFPDTELMPYHTMLDFYQRGLYDIEGYYVDDRLLGYAMLCVDEVHDYALIDYFGIVSGMRNNGLGTRLMGLVQQHYANYQGILAEVEAPAGHSTKEDTLIMRRLGFYKRAGFVRLPYDMSLFGVRYRTLVYPASGGISPSRALAAHQRLYQKQFSPQSYAKHVQLPLGHEKLMPCSPWTEEDELLNEHTCH